jgi:hypothetical protein
VELCAYQTVSSPTERIQLATSTTAQLYYMFMSCMLIILIYIYLFIFLFCLFALVPCGPLQRSTFACGSFYFIFACCMPILTAEPTVAVENDIVPFSYLLFPSGQRNFKIQPIVWLQRHLIKILVALRYYHYY